MFGVGCFFIVLALLWFASKVYVAYTSAKCPHASGGVPTIDGALLPPLAFVYGLSKLRMARPEMELPNLWIIWLAATVLGVLIHVAISRIVKPCELTERPGKNRRDPTT